MMIDFVILFQNQQTGTRSIKDKLDSKDLTRLHDISKNKVLDMPSMDGGKCSSNL